MDTRSCQGIRRTGFVLSALCAMLVSPLPARAADAPKKERIPDVVATPAAQTSPEGAKYVGKEACANCHADQVKAFDKTFHGRKALSNDKLAQACESCHGPGSVHADSADPSKILNPKKMSAEATASLCMDCHKDKALVLWKTGAHADNGVSCTTCHSVHEGEGRKSLTKGATDACLQCHKKQQADMKLPSHHPVVEGKMTCTSCHNPHGGVEANLKAESVNEQCATCHSEKVGPFISEHPPVVDSCLNCHMPHGSANDRLLKMPVQILCMSCHRKEHTTFSTGNTTQAVWQQRERCTDCHREIHGSDRSQNLRQ